MNNETVSQTHALGMMGLDRETFKPSARNSFRGACPACGGHRRLVVYVNGPFPAWYATCDLCDFRGWATQLNPALDAGAHFEIPTRAPEEVERRRAAATRLLGSLRASKADVFFFENMQRQHVEWWEMVGIPEGMQGFWQLGHTDSHVVKDDDGRLRSYEAYTIPRYGLGWELNNIDFRLIDAPKDIGKYRCVPGLPPAPFLSHPDMPSLTNPKGTAFIVEGAKKAMVASMFMNDAQVIGSPAVRSWAGIVDALKREQAEVIYVILDPDGWNAARRLCKEIGPRSVQVTLPGKIDDLILQDAISKEQLARLLTLSRRRPQAIPGLATLPNSPPIQPSKIQGV